MLANKTHQALCAWLLVLTFGSLPLDAESSSALSAQNQPEKNAGDVFDTDIQFVLDTLQEREAKIQELERQLDEMSDDTMLRSVVEDELQCRRQQLETAVKILVHRDAIRLARRIGNPKQIERQQQRISLATTSLRQQASFLSELQRIRSFMAGLAESSASPSTEAQATASEIRRTHELLTDLHRRRLRLKSNQESSAARLTQAIELHQKVQSLRLDRFRLLNLQASSSPTKTDNDRLSISRSIGKIDLQLKSLLERAEDINLVAAPSSNDNRNALLDTDVTATTPIAFENDVLPVLRQRCFDCHSNSAQEGDLNIEALLETQPLVKKRDLWLNIQQQVKAGVMPPADADAASIQERRHVIQWIDQEVVNFDYQTVRQPGLEVARRLTHAEYNHTVSDLVGLELQPTRGFPEESAGASGFDNSGNTLFLQAELLERYFGAAEEVLDAAMPDEGITSPGIQRHFPFLKSTPAAHAGEDDLRAAIASFVSAAFRRPATTEEVDRYTERCNQAVSNGENLHKAIKQTLATVLIHPHFLMRIESKVQDGQIQEVASWELANRLSYFLWGSMPDGDLVALAKIDRLSDPQVLRSQIDRMLDDRHFESLGEQFGAQWLGYQHLGTRIRLDPIDNPWCTDSLMAAMKEETALFLVHLFRENARLHELVNADWSFLNEELANHYGIDGVEGPEMRRVDLNTSQRGGLFGQASVLAVTSFPDRTSPVVRGKWLLADVLGTPPPPPPPNVSEFDEAIIERDELSTKQKLALHRRKPNCAGCHDQIDPLGLSLENYGRFGRWRRRSEEGRIDATGELPNGTRFRGLSGLQTVIVEQRIDDLAKQLVRKLLSYALGRQLEYYDEAAVQTIHQKFASKDYRMRELIYAIAESYPFRYRGNTQVNSQP